MRIRLGWLLNSGWNWLPSIQGWSSRSSAISTNRAVGRQPAVDQTGFTQPLVIGVVEFPAVALRSLTWRLAIGGCGARVPGCNTRIDPSRMVPPISAMSLVKHQVDDRFWLCGSNSGAVARSLPRCAAQTRWTIT